MRKHQADHALITGRIMTGPKKKLKKFGEMI
jgi:hypothetical protein